MSYTHVTINERAKIEILREEGHSIREIARKLNRDPSTISREFRRHENYTAEQAHTRYQANKANCGAKIKCTPVLKEAVQEKLGNLVA
ncbi:helix-turn-helix domain-containing protein [Lysinibacillus sp. FSL K6-1151]|uniref:helix-turn-helix domain-containing protein n=1 Tax=Lysinibacillus sp. FSL K6-1151 TaxID=2921465 RepID=UPI00315A682C